MIFTTLHAGGKFEPGNYKTAGGLHGVGASVVNALSKELVARMKRDGYLWEQRFKQGQPQGAVKKGDPTIFPKVEFDPDVIRQRLEVASHLHKGVRVVFEDEANAAKETFEHREGLVEYLKKIVAERSARPVHEIPFTLQKENGLRVDLVLQWTEATDEHLRSP